MNNLIQAMIRPLLEEFIVWQAKYEKRKDPKIYNPLLTREEYKAAYEKASEQIGAFFDEQSNPYHWDDSE